MSSTSSCLTNHIRLKTPTETHLSVTKYFLWPKRSQVLVILDWRFCEHFAPRQHIPVPGSFQRFSVVTFQERHVTAQRAMSQTVTFGQVSDVFTWLYPGCQRFFFSLGVTELSGEAAKASREAARKIKSRRPALPRSLRFSSLVSERTSGIQGNVARKRNKMLHLKKKR